jgi:hypothetical protein
MGRSLFKKQPINLWEVNEKTFVLLVRCGSRRKNLLQKLKTFGEKMGKRYMAKCFIFKSIYFEKLYQGTIDELNKV